MVSWLTSDDQDGSGFFVGFFCGWVYIKMQGRVSCGSFMWERGVPVLALENLQDFFIGDITHF